MLILIMNFKIVIVVVEAWQRWPVCWQSGRQWNQKAQIITGIEIQTIGSVYSEMYSCHDIASHVSAIRLCCYGLISFSEGPRCLSFTFLTVYLLMCFIILFTFYVFWH